MIATGLLAAGCAATMPAAKSAGPLNDRYVVMAAKSPFYSFGPAQGSGPDFNLRAGQPLRLLQRDYGFSRVQLDNGRSGYVSTDDIAPAPAAPPVPAPKAKSRLRDVPADFPPPSEAELPVNAPTFRY